jgi:ATP/maltotriose-dependent transcriptional regulator MalT/DNA-binding SARP family transcriptional activator
MERISTTGGMPKITMPSMPKCYLRQRVFARLNHLASCGLIWISAPAGYGKTTAASSYLRDSRRPTIWYQCDEDDADIGSFFHYLALARKSLLDGALPAFAPQYLTAVPTFCRNFFRHWFAELPHGSTLVLDNWQDVPADAALTHLLPIITDQLPAQAQLIVISRNEPGANMGRLASSERMGKLDITDLQLSREETDEVVRLQAAACGRSEAIDVDGVYATTQGWAAGVTLLMRHGIRAQAAPQHGRVGSTQTIFDYLAAEAFERLNLPSQDFLLRVACLEHIRVCVAQRLFRGDDVASILETLTRQNVFTVYRADADSYHFHPLFRSFLQRRLAATRAPEEQREWLLAAARALSAEGDSEAGIYLLLQARGWAEAASLIRAVAAKFVEQARLTTLLHWIEALPSDTVADDGWLIYWRGICGLTLDFASARAYFEDAYACFRASEDRAGEMLACSAILQHITYGYLDYRAMLPWISTLERILDEAPRFPDSRVELKVRAAFMLALSQAIPRHTKLMSSVEQVASLVRAEHDLISRAEGISALLHFFSRFGRTPQYGDLDVVLGQTLDDGALPPIHRLNLLWLHAYQLHSSGDPERVLAILGEARALARHEGLQSEDTRMRLCELQAQEIAGSTTLALATFSELEPYVRGMPPIPRAHFLYVRAIFELACGNIEDALKYSEQSVPLIRTCHWHIGEALALTGLAEVYCALGRYGEASRCLYECASITEGVQAPLVEFNTQLVRAEIARNVRSRDEFEIELAKAFALGREQGYANGFHTSSQMLRRLVPYGVQLGIEASYCRWVITKRRFQPPNTGFAGWPWPVKIRAMGRLRIYLEDAELTFSGKAQRKPLDMLKLLIALPHGVEMNQCVDTLWPDLEGDAARNAMDIALHRLRKILRAKDAVQLSNGSVMLNKNIVWLDAMALEHFSPELLRSGELPRTIDEVLDLYRGSLLAAEEASGPILRARDRLRAKFLHIVSHLAKRLEQSQRWDEMASLYVRAIEREPCEEPLRRGLLHALRGQGQNGQASLVPRHRQIILAEAPVPMATPRVRRRGVDRRQNLR